MRSTKKSFVEALTNQGANQAQGDAQKPVKDSMEELHFTKVKHNINKAIFDDLEEALAPNPEVNSKIYIGGPSPQPNALDIDVGEFVQALIDIGLSVENMRGFNTINTTRKHCIYVTHG